MRTILVCEEGRVSLEVQTQSKTEISISVLRRPETSGPFVYRSVASRAVPGVYPGFSAVSATLRFDVPRRTTFSLCTSSRACPRDPLRPVPMQRHGSQRVLPPSVKRQVPSTVLPLASCCPHAYSTVLKPIYTSSPHITYCARCRKWSTSNVTVQDSAVVYSRM